jgi:hypothetical protein
MAVQKREREVDKASACSFALVSVKHWNERAAGIAVEEDYFVIPSALNNVQLTTINLRETKAAVI